MSPSPDIPELRTARLLLRGFTRPDMDVWNERLFGDLDVIRYLPIDGPLTVDELDASLARGYEHWRTRGYGAWAVTAAGSGELMGHCGLRYLDDLAETELLYSLAKPYWGLGYTTEAARAALEFGLERGGLVRVVAYAVPENVASIRVMEKLGMTLEGEADIFGLHCVRYAIERPPDGD